MSATLEPSAPPSLAVVILTRNEEVNLGRALASVRGIATEIVVVDSGSTDRTVAIAEAHGARVVTRSFVNYADQYQWALDTIPLAAQWVARLDADEVFSEALRAEIVERLPALPPGVVAVTLRRELLFMGCRIRFGGRKVLTLTRIWRRGQARIEQRWMDEHIVIDGGRTVAFTHPFHDDNRKPLSSYIDKHNDYATREAIDRILSRRLGIDNGDQDIREMSPALRLKRLLKKDVYNRLPFAVGPILYFLVRYIVLLGFLDGRTGLIYQFLQGFWYRFLVECKDRELSARLGDERRPEAIFAILAEATGKDMSFSRSRAR